jgi:thiol-disulfide isomerase/thioredoxin
MGCRSDSNWKGYVWIMNKKVKIFLMVLLLAVLIGGAAFAYSALTNNAGSPDVLTPVSGSGSLDNAQASPQRAPGGDGNAAQDDGRILAPDVTVVDVDGNEVKLSDLLGRPIVMNFWTSWCPPCKAEMPEFDKVCGDLGADVSFMMIDLVDGQRETMEMGRQHVSAQGFTFPVYYDVLGEAGYFYGISSIPTTLFIDKEGYIVTGAQGAIDEATLRKGIGYITGD